MSRGDNNEWSPSTLYTERVVKVLVFSSLTHLSCIVGKESIVRGPTIVAMNRTESNRYTPWPAGGPLDPHQWLLVLDLATVQQSTKLHVLLTCNLYSQIMSDNTVPGCYVPSTQVRWVRFGTLHIAKRTNGSHQGLAQVAPNHCHSHFPLSQYITIPNAGCGVYMAFLPMVWWWTELYVTFQAVLTRCFTMATVVEVWGTYLWIILRECR